MISAIIPAKKESTGVENKNFRTFDPNTDESLLDLAMLSALNSRVDSVVLAIDDKEIGETVKEKYQNWDKPIFVYHRPKELSYPMVQVDTVVWFTAIWLEKTLGSPAIPETLVILQPTSPLRNYRHINEALDLYEVPNEEDNEAPLVSVSSLEKFAYETLGAFVYPVHHTPSTRLGRQHYDIDDFLYVENGAIYIASTKFIIANKTFRSDIMVPYVMSEKDSIEVDTWDHWHLAQRQI